MENTSEQDLTSKYFLQQAQERYEKANTEPQKLEALKFLHELYKESKQK